jgi:hypothetical protein
VQQLYSEYRRSGSVPEPRKAGRPRKGVSEEERESVIELRRRYGIGASYIGRILRGMGISIGNDRI